MNRVTGVRKRNVHSVSIKFTAENQKAMMTARITPTLPIMSMPQKSICFKLGESANCCIRYHPKDPTIATVKAIEN